MRIILVGKAASGKDYFRDYLSSVELLDVSYTTRPQRYGEIPNYTYKFINENRFTAMRKNKLFFQTVEFNGWNYGTSLESWNSNTVFIMTPSAIKSLSEDTLKECVIVYFDIPIEIRSNRLTERSDADKVERRLIADEEDFKDFKKFNIRVDYSKYKPEALYTTILSYSKTKDLI